MRSGQTLTSDKTRDTGDYVDKTLRLMEQQRATLAVVEDQEARRKALSAIASQSAALQKYLGAAAARGAPARETTAVIRAAQNLPKSPSAWSAAEPLTALLTLIVALGALKRKLRSTSAR